MNLRSNLSTSGLVQALGNIFISCNFLFPMDEVADRLFISSWEVAKNNDQLKNYQVSSIVAVGCDYLPSDRIEVVEYLLYPKILDDPEVLIIHVLSSCCHFIQKRLEGSGNALVHCVYGQSRSAVVCVAYMMHCGVELTEALISIKEKHADVCINPGFLCQLHLLSQIRIDTNALNVYRLLLFSYGCNDDLIENRAEVTSKKYSCKYCGCSFCDDTAVIDPQQSYSANGILKQFTDDYWLNYRPQSSYSSDVLTFPISSSNYFFVVPLQWVVDQMKANVNAKEGELLCPQCSEVCGSWRRKCLNIIGPYNLCDYIVLNRKAVKIKRVIN